MIVKAPQQILPCAAFKPSIIPIVARHAGNDVTYDTVACSQSYESDLRRHVWLLEKKWQAAVTREPDVLGMHDSKC